MAWCNERQSIGHFTNTTAKSNVCVAIEALDMLRQLMYRVHARTADESDLVIDEASIISEALQKILKKNMHVP